MKQQTTKIWACRVVVALVLALALSVLLEFLQISSQPKQYRIASTEINEVEVLPAACLFHNSVYDESSGTLIPTDGDAQVIIPLSPALRISGIALFFSEPIGADCPVQIFWAVPDAGFTEQSSLWGTIPAGSLEAEFRLPEAEYGMLRLDPDQPLPLERFALGEVQGVREAVVEPFRLKRMATVAAFLTGFFLLLAMLPEERRPLAVLHRFIRLFRGRKKAALVGCGVFVGTGLLMFLVLRFLILPWYGFAADTLPQILLCVAASILVALLAAFHKNVGKKPEIFFVALSLLCGTLLAFYLPTTSYVSWDDEYHFIRALNASYLGETRYTPQEERTIVYPPDQNYALAGEVREEYLSRQDRLYASGASAVVTSGIAQNDVWEFPAALGLYVGRVLRLPWYWIYCLGRWFALLAYTVVGYFAIRRLKSGKMILAVVLLIPTNIFLAANYSYDPGLTGLCALGYSYWIAEWQEPEKPLRSSSALIMLGAMSLGLMIKAIFFPMMLPLLFLPKEKFADRMKRNVYTAAVLLCTVALVLTFAIPYTAGPVLTDSRGGSDVDAAAQIRGALADPFRYASILGRFLMGYLHPDSFQYLLTFYAYQGVSGNVGIYLILMAVVAFTARSDRDERLANARTVRALSLLFLLAALALAASSMYAIFTPVGAETINGFQPRYMIPLIFPAMMLIGTGTSRLRMNRNAYAIAAYVVVAFVNYSGIMMNCIGLYS